MRGGASLPAKRWAARGIGVDNLKGHVRSRRVQKKAQDPPGLFGSGRDLSSAIPLGRGLGQRPVPRCRYPSKEEA